MYEDIYISVKLSDQSMCLRAIVREFFFTYRLGFGERMRYEEFIKVHLHSNEPLEY